MKVYFTDVFFLMSKKDDIFTLMSKRRLQLNTQAQIDNQLISLPCPLIVNRLLFYEREMNRKLVDKMNKAENVEEYVKVLEESYNVVDKHVHKIQSFLKCDSCEKMEKYLKNIE